MRNRKHFISHLKSTQRTYIEENDTDLQDLSIHVQIQERNERPYIFNAQLAEALFECRTSVNVMTALSSMFKEDDTPCQFTFRLGNEIWYSVLFVKSDDLFLLSNHKTAKIMLKYIGLLGDSLIFGEGYFGGDYLETAEEQHIDFVDDVGMTENQAQRLARGMYNALLYLASGSPDLRHYTPPDRNTGTRRERDRLTHEFGTEPAIFVSWGWKKPAIHHVDSCEVSGHWRMQPHGVERKLVKLIWIDNYVKTFNKTKEML